MCTSFRLLLIMVSIILLEAAPGRSKSSSKSTPHTVYDQKQHGDYNIQLHLKDFQIIALMSDDLGGLGDYDYSYDYADFTVKPPASSSSTTGSTTTTTKTPPSTTARPNSFTQTTASPLTAANASPPSPNNLSPLLSATSSVSSLPLQVSSFSSEKTSTTENVNKINISDDKVGANKTKPNESSLPTTADNNPVPSKSSNTSAVPSKLVSTSTSASSTPTKISVTSTLAVEESPLTTAVPGKIKVQIIGVPQEQTQDSLPLIPGETMADFKPTSGVPQQESSTLAQKEKRCLTGFTRDKWGRCRRVRRPGGGVASQIPFDINRLASLASKFRFGASGLTSQLEIED